jgi:uncharacterized protein
LGLVVCAQPFAEEMNKSRRMVALGSRALADMGFAVAQLDLSGCGDSTGDLCSAGWHDWVEDVCDALAFLEQVHGKAPVWLWGVRAGSLVLAEAARRIAVPANFLLWQAQSSGKVALQQFLRLDLANQLQASAKKSAAPSLRERLAAGESIDVAGYELGPRLAVGLEGASLTPSPARAHSSVVWLEVGRTAPFEVQAASKHTINDWLASGAQVKVTAVAGAPFWQTLDIEVAPALLSATIDLLRETRAADADD